VDELCDQSDGLLLTCELAAEYKVIGRIPLFRSHIDYNELARQSVECRINYIAANLDDALSNAIVKLWNKSGKETERATVVLKNDDDVEWALKEWRRRDKKEVLAGTGYERISHGGARRKKIKKEETPRPLSTYEKCREFTRIADQIMSFKSTDSKDTTWKRIVIFFRASLGGIEVLKHESYFSDLHNQYPIPDSLLRQASERKKMEAKRLREGRTVARKEVTPRGLAYQHAFRQIYNDEKMYPSIPCYTTLANAYHTGHRKKKPTAKTTD
jgi:hypothetical protein